MSEASVPAGAIPPEGRLPNLLEMQLGLVANEARLAHNQFEKEHWQINPLAQIDTPQGRVAPSFHSWERHIGPAQEVAQILCARLSEGIDPFHINSQIEQYNREQGEQATLDDFTLATKYILAPGHDIGNLTEKGELVDGQIEFADIYLRVGAEDRSIALMTALFNKHVTELFTPQVRARAERIMKLGAYLTDQTKFSMDKAVSERPFWTFVQVLDQIATYYRTPASYEDMVVGLMNEWGVREEKPGILREWIEFGIKRLEALVPDEQQRKGILAILDPTGEKYKAISEAGEKMKAKVGNVDRPINWKEDSRLLLVAAAA